MASDSSAEKTLVRQLQARGTRDRADARVRVPRLIEEQSLYTAGAAPRAVST